MAYLDILTQTGINRQNALTMLIPNIVNDAVLYQTDYPNKISDYCSFAGITKDSLHSTKPIAITK